jgi:hypothetical protein
METGNTNIPNSYQPDNTNKTHQENMQNSPIVKQRGGGGGEAPNPQKKPE